MHTFFLSSLSRAGAVEQLKTHCGRLKVPLYERGYEKDPAKVRTYTQVPFLTASTSSLTPSEHLAYLASLFYMQKGVTGSQMQQAGGPLLVCLIQLCV
jgi:hypothetical protein